MNSKEMNYKFRCVGKYLESSKCQELLDDISRCTLNVSMENATLSEQNKQILIEDLTTLVESNFDFFYFSENQKFLHKKYIEEFSKLDSKSIFIVIDKIKMGCGTWELEYRICTNKSQFVTDDINLIKLITINDD